MTRYENIQTAMQHHALNIFTAAVRAVQPHHLMLRHIQLQQNNLRLGEQVFALNRIDKIYAIGAGKASAAMAREVERILGSRLHAGIVVTKHGHAVPLKTIRCIEAGHPVPDEMSVVAGRHIVRLLKEASANDLVIALISGGASALLVDCPPGINLSELQKVFNLLLACGATIQEMNTVRKHLSAGIKGGQLARTASPATLVSFILSDVIGDALESIASGPTVADPGTFADAWQILRKYELPDQLPVSIIRWLQMGLGKQISDTPKPGDEIFNKCFNELIGTNRIALEAAAAAARELKYEPVIITDAMTGEARDQANSLVQQVMHYKGPRPACLLLGGETTVTLRHKGKGGRNQEFVLAALLAMEQQMKEAATWPVILSAGTDGTDGPTDAAGAMASAQVMETAKKLNLNAGEYLAQNDSYHFFQKAGGHVITGPTQTNVMDIVVVLIP